MDRLYLVHFLRKISAECGARGRDELGGEFDSLSTPPPAIPRYSRMRRKKARPLRVSFHSSGFVYPSPDKKASLRSFRSSWTYCVRTRFASSSSSLSFSLLLRSLLSSLSRIRLVIVGAIFVACRFVRRNGTNRDSRGKKSAALSLTRRCNMKKEVRPYSSGRTRECENGTRDWMGGGGEREC